jgi:procollagen-lysine,2-oxoglutarate 5-dioxygenase, invertebrate
LKDDYPPVGNNEKRFLNSGLIIGYAADFLNMIQYAPIKDSDDDQLFYTKFFLIKHKEAGLKLDTRSELFQNLNGASHEISIFSIKNELHVFNNQTQTVPSILHGNGGSKVYKFKIEIKSGKLSILKAKKKHFLSLKIIFSHSYL